MKKVGSKNKKDFFGLNTSEKAKVVRRAVDEATREQLALVKRHGGIKALKSYSGCKKLSNKCPLI